MDETYKAYQVPGNSGSISRISKATGYSIIDSKTSMEYIAKRGW